MPLDLYNKAKNYVKEKTKVVAKELRKIDPALKDSRVNELLREFDSEVLVPLINNLKEGALSGPILMYIQYLEAQAAGKYKKLPGDFVDAAQPYYNKISLQDVRYAENIHTVHGQCITIGNKIYITGSVDWKSVGDIWIMLHELEHVTQYEAVGGVSEFILKYLLQGGLTMINNGTFNPHDKIPLEREANRKAEKVTATVAKAMRAKKTKRMEAVAITDIKIITDDVPFIRVPDGYCKDRVDLNAGAGGKFIYLCYRRDASKPLTSLAVLTGGSPDVQPSAGMKKIPVDVNMGAGGEYIYLCYAKGGSRPVRDIRIVASDSSDVFAPEGFKLVKKDLNAGAGGLYLYLSYRL